MMNRFAFVVMLIICSCAVLAADAISQTAAPKSAAVPDSAEILRKRVIAAYGADQFGEVDAIKYTFNIQSGDRKATRQWTWEPHTNCVTFHGKGPKGDFIDYSYTHTKTDTSDTTIEGFVDQRFINDNYWFLFPCHLVWDSNMVLSTSNVNVSKEYGSLEHFSVHYNSGGYTPGDTYVLFPDRSGLLQWWVHFRGGKQDQGSMMTWEDHVRVGPIVLTTSHRSQDGAFHLWFSDISVKLHGNPKWIDAK